MINVSDQNKEVLLDPEKKRRRYVKQTPRLRVPEKPELISPEPWSVENLAPTRIQLSSFGKPGSSRHRSYEPQFFSLKKFPLPTFPPFLHSYLQYFHALHRRLGKHTQTHIQTRRTAIVVSHNKTTPTSATSTWIYSIRCLCPSYILQNVVENTVISFPLRRIPSQISLFSFFYSAYTFGRRDIATHHQPCPRNGRRSPEKDCAES